MLYTLESSTLRIAVNQTGAELFNIVSKKTDTEYLWQGDPTYWGSRAPVLFPVIGGLRGGNYTHEGQSYQLPKHGFVRRADFSAKHTLDRLVFEYTDNSQTRAVFPFDFVFTVAFTLESNVIHIENQVENRGKGPLYFSVGAHEAYRCPIHEHECFEDYFLEFGQEETLESHIVNGATGLLTGETYPIALQEGRILPLKHSLFKNDALIFKNIKNKKITIKSRKNPAFIEVIYDAPHLGIWTKPGAPYVCIEPWYGLPDYKYSDGIFANKEGNVCLNVGGIFTFNHSIVINE